MNTEVVGYIYTLSLLGLVILTIGSGIFLIRLYFEWRRVEASVDRAIRSRRAQYPEGVVEATVESRLTGGQITPETVQRFIDRGWLDPR